MCDPASKVLGRTLFQDGQPASRGHRRITIGHKQILASRSTPRHVYDGAFFPLKPLVESNRFRAQLEGQWNDVQVCVDRAAAGHRFSINRAVLENHRTAICPLYNINRTIDKLPRSEEHTSELQSLMRISYAVFCLKNKN